MGGKKPKRLSMRFLFYSIIKKKKKGREKDTYVKIHVFFYLPIQVFTFTCILVFLKVSQETQTEIL